LRPSTSPFMRWHEQILTALSSHKEGRGEAETVTRWNGFALARGWRLMAGGRSPNAACAQDTRAVGDLRPIESDIASHKGTGCKRRLKSETLDTRIAVVLLLLIC